MRENNGRIKKWTLWTLLLAFLLVIGAYFYGTFLPHTQNRQQVTALAQKYAHLTKVNKYYEFSYDGQNYQSVLGSNRQGKKIYAIVADNKRKINVYSSSKVISARTAIDYVKSKRQPKKILKAVPGLIDHGKRPVWEVTYLNQEGNLCYTLMSLKNGTVIKEIRNL